MSGYLLLLLQQQLLVHFLLIAQVQRAIRELLKLQLFDFFDQFLVVLFKFSHELHFVLQLPLVRGAVGRLIVLVRSEIALGQAASGVFVRLERIDRTLG